MNVFEKYSIEEINKRTKISPISLRYIKNKEFNKIPRVKFIGFIRIIENEFKVDLSDLIKEYEEVTKNIKRENSEIKFEKVKKTNDFSIIIFSIILITIGGYYLYKNINTSIEKNYSVAVKVEKNLSDVMKNKQNDEIEQNKVIVKKIEKNITNTNDNNITENNLTIENTENNLTIENNSTTQIKFIQIIPKETVWFKAINLDNNKTIEYLTSLPKDLNGSNWYIKFGHGLVTIRYGEEIIDPNTKKIVRILLKNGKYEFINKPNRYEK